MQAVRLLPLPGVFQPHSDSWMLAERIKCEPLEPGARALDLCTGSGLLAVTAALLGAEAYAIDVSRRALVAVRLNARLNGVTVRALGGDLFAPVQGERFDMIVSNPPYLPSPGGGIPDRGAARAWEGGPNGRSFIDRICAQAHAYLNPAGVLLLVHSSVCGERETTEALRARGLQTSVVARSRGGLGPRMRTRTAWLRQRGLLPSEDVEELVVVRAQRPASAVQPEGRVADSEQGSMSIG